MLFDDIMYMNYQTGDENIDIEQLLQGDSLYLFSGVKEGNSLVGDFKSYAYPNPFDRSVRIGYVLDQPTKVEVESITFTDN